MNRDRFKFRVWDGEKKAYAHEGYVVTQLGLVGTYDPFVGLIRNINCTIEQCTGLTDKNGKLIYEGDLLGDSKDDEDFIEICWCDTLASFMYDIFPETRGNLETCHADYLAKFEIIGNIHEDQFREVTKKMEENR